MVAVSLPNKITGEADGRVRAEEAQWFDPLPLVSSDTYALDEAPGVIASVERIDAWMGVARPNDVFTYATRAFLPASSTGARRMRELNARGLVRLTQARCAPGVSLFHYRATRTMTATPLAKPDRALLSARVIDAEAALIDKVLPVLDRAARFGRPCPTDKQLAEKCGLEPVQIEPALHALVMANLIRIHAAPRPTVRRVTIVASGAQTGLVA